MPQQTVYIRADDLDKWRKLPNKSAAISELLNKPTQEEKKYCEHGFIVGRCAKC